ncbi:FadR family transcriptional regulator, partial [Mesorhizobium sp. M7A.F.Ca.CA.004.04.1.1]
AYTTREIDDLNHAQKLHEAIEKNIRLQRPDAARNAVRKLLANTDGVIRAR